MLTNPSLGPILLTAIKKRLPLRKYTNALRLVNSKADHLEGLVLEQYDRHFVAQVFDSRWLNQTEELKNFLCQHFNVDFFIIKDRSKSTRSTADAFQTSIIIDKAPSTCIVQENGLNFKVDLNDTLNTGLFLDMRANRLKVAQSCASRKVLNCFAYTCSFGVYARAFKAAEVVNVDISPKILQRGQVNYEINKLAFSQKEFIKADAREYLKKAVKINNSFDIIIIDPPSFARSKTKVFNIEKSLPELVADALEILNDKGKLLIATNCSQVSYNKLEEIFRKYRQSRVPKKLTRLGQDEDFLGSGLSKESHLVAVWVEY